jgi:hypothetical protein
LLRRANATAQLQYALPWDPAVIKRYLHLACPSPASFSQTGHGAGRAYDPEPPGSKGDEPLPAGTALAPPAGVAGWRALGERDSCFVTETGTNVKIVLVAATFGHYNK